MSLTVVGIDGGPLPPGRPRPFATPRSSSAPPAPGRVAGAGARRAVELGLGRAGAGSTRRAATPSCWPAATPGSSASCGCSASTAPSRRCCRRCPAWPPPSPGSAGRGTTSRWSARTAGRCAPAVNVCRARAAVAVLTAPGCRPGRDRRRRWTAGRAPWSWPRTSARPASGSAPSTRHGRGPRPGPSPTWCSACATAPAAVAAARVVRRRRADPAARWLGAARGRRSPTATGWSPSPRCARSRWPGSARGPGRWCGTSAPAPGRSAWSAPGSARR